MKEASEISGYLAALYIWKKKKDYDIFTPYAPHK